jgi:hypothetical protein
LLINVVEDAGHDRRDLFVKSPKNLGIPLYSEVRLYPSGMGTRSDRVISIRRIFTRKLQSRKNITTDTRCQICCA